MNGPIGDMPYHERPLSESYRLAANAWVDADAAARLREEMKSTVLEQQKQVLVRNDPKLPDSHAERMVKAGKDWEEFIHQMVDAKTEANRLKYELKVIEMREREQNERNQSIRAEMRMAR